LGLITYSKVEHYVAKPRNRAVRVIRLVLKLVGLSCTPNLRVGKVSGNMLNFIAI